jgi:cellulose synthase/poly-beta-1,6-N-acetylglucosamine synthase-like glycosyltransferase
MKTILFALMCAFTLTWLAVQLLRPPSRRKRSIDALVAAFNEEPCIEVTLLQLLDNEYVAKVICVNDGSSDGTAAILDAMALTTPRLTVVHQENTGKGGALMNGLQHVTADQVFVTDADTIVPVKGHGLGYMLAEIERGADAVGGIPSSNLVGARLLPYIRATVKYPMIQIKRTFQQLIGGAPFIISGACGLFRTEVLRKVGFSDRTKVEDLDLTWSLIAAGYRVRICNFSVVYSQECNSVSEEWLRWRRWVIGYAVCMRLHWRLLLTRFGLFTILPMFLVVAVGVTTYSFSFTNAAQHDPWWAVPMVLFPLLWMGIVSVLGLISSIHHRSGWLVPLAPLAIIYVLLAYAIWVVHGIAGLITGHEPARDKPTRYTHVVA